MGPTALTVQQKNAEKVPLVSAVLNAEGMASNFRFDTTYSEITFLVSRLKLRCDRAIPCSSCVKRGCGAICPDVGILPCAGVYLTQAALL